MSAAKADYRAAWRDIRIGMAYPPGEQEWHAFFDEHGIMGDRAWSAWHNRQNTVFTGWKRRFNREWFVSRLGEDPLGRIPF